MSAKTQYDLARLTLDDDYEHIRAKIRKGQLPENVQAQLKRAIRLARENKLGAVMETNAESHMAGQELYTILNHELKDLVSRHSYSYAEAHGFKLVGELYRRIRLFRDAKSTKWQVECRQLIDNFGLPMGLNLDETGWVPPYAKDPAILAIWQQRVHEASAAEYQRPVNQTFCHHLGGCVTVGEHLRHGRARPALRYHFKIHEMYVPRVWQAPLRDPVGCAIWGTANFDGEKVSPLIVEKLKALGITKFSYLAGVESRIIEEAVGPHAREGLENLLKKHGFFAQNDRW